MTWVLRDARSRDLDAVRELLGSCDLSALGLEDQFVKGYIVAELRGDVVGAVGIEIHGRHGLLRSLAVKPGRRDTGIGTALIRERLDWAQLHGIDSIYLLTTTADGYFVRHGFVPVAREDAPDEIRATKEFSEMCPSSAVLMKLTRGGAR